MSNDLDEDAAVGKSDIDPTGRAGRSLTVDSIGEAWAELLDTVGEELDAKAHPRVLEAGAGTRTLFDLPPDAHVVGVDRDPEAIGRNVRLDERVVAELADYEQVPDRFDLITCWYVLAGLRDPAPVLDRFVEWTAPG